MAPWEQGAICQYEKVISKEMESHEPDAVSMNALAALYNPPGYIITLGRGGTQVIEA
jgi:hypothetical protein